MGNFRHEMAFLGGKWILFSAQETEYGVIVGIKDLIMSGVMALKFSRYKSFLGEEENHLTRWKANYPDLSTTDCIHVLIYTTPHKYCNYYDSIKNNFKNSVISNSCKIANHSKRTIYSA